MKRKFTADQIARTKRIQIIRKGIRPENISDLANSSLEQWKEFQKGSTSSKLSPEELKKVKNVLSGLLKEINFSILALDLWTLVPQLDESMTPELDEIVEAKLKELRTASTEIRFCLS